MKQKILNNFIYQFVTKKIKKTNLPVILKKSKSKQLDFRNINYTNRGNITSKNQINPINFDKIEIFNDIVGYDDIKRLFLMAINSVEPIHIALVGPPASAKTIFMRCL